MRLGLPNPQFRLGIAIPGRVFFVALHDLPPAAYLRPSLTTVSMPLQTLGARAVELLLSTDPHEPVREVVSEPIVLIHRESSGRART